MTETTAEWRKTTTPRVWPGVLLVVIQWLAWQLFPKLFPEAALYGLLVGVLGGALGILIWWLFLSRLPWADRLGGVILIVVGLVVTRFLVHVSIAQGGMGFLMYFFAIPIMCLALVLAAVVSRRLSQRPRRVALVTAIVLACASLTLVRTEGISGEGTSDFRWRWTPTPEERLLAAGNTNLAEPSKNPLADQAHVNWTGFRGPDRNSVVREAVRLATDWSRSKPVELWRRPIGPGWSSFAVSGSLVFTQEQRGEDEIVSCYHISTGQPVWMHRDAARFWESNAGAGPRATPTVHDGRVYTLGATGIVNALNASDGKVIWSCNAAADTEAKVPEWAFAGSPLVVDDLVIIATAGRLVAYDRHSGQRRWLGPTGIGGYSSPHLATLDGVRQILLLKNAGVVSVNPADGKELWKYSWKGDGIVQPAVTTDGEVLIGSGSGLNSEVGIRSLALAKTAEGWNVRERWSTRGLRPYYNDFVVHKSHAYGIDGAILACIDLTDGQRKWKGGRYGHGQVLLLPEQDLLLILSEKGEVALVSATPEQHKELSKFKAIEGKTWNHPVLVGDMLLVRNGEEMAAFRLPHAP